MTVNRTSRKLSTARAGFRKSTGSRVLRFDRRSKPRKTRLLATRGFQDARRIKNGSDNLQAAAFRDEEKREESDGEVTLQPQGFTSLPLELREQVYGHLMSDFPTEVFLHGNDDGPVFTYLPKDALPSLAYVNHQMFLEVGIVYIRHTKLIVSSRSSRLSHRLFDFLNYFPDGRAFKSVRRLEYMNPALKFTGDPGYRRSERHVADVVMRCTGLQHLTLRFGAFALVVRNRRYDGHNPNHKTKSRFERLVTPLELDQDIHLSDINAHEGSFTLRLSFRTAHALARTLRCSVSELLDPYRQAFDEYEAARKQDQIGDDCRIRGAPLRQQSAWGMMNGTRRCGTHESERCHGCRT